MMARKIDKAIKGMRRKAIGNGYWGPYMRNAKDGNYVSAQRAAQKINAQQAEIEMLRLALDVAMGFHAPNVPGDSRAVPDWFVACAAVQCSLKDSDGKIKECLIAAEKITQTLPAAEPAMTVEVVQ